MTRVSLMALLLDGYRSTQMMISEYCFRQWLGAVMQQVGKIDSDLCRRMVWLGYKELKLAIPGLLETGDCQRNLLHPMCNTWSDIAFITLLLYNTKSLSVLQSLNGKVLQTTPLDTRIYLTNAPQPSGDKGIGKNNTASLWRGCSPINHLPTT